MQQGKGDASGMFGGGSSAAVFGASGAGSFVTKLTTFLVVLFFINCLALAYMAKNKVAQDSIIISDEATEIQKDKKNSSDSSNSNTTLEDDLVIPD